MDGNIYMYIYSRQWQVRILAQIFSWTCIFILISTWKFFLKSFSNAYKFSWLTRSKNRNRTQQLVPSFLLLPRKWRRCSDNSHRSNLWQTILYKTNLGSLKICLLGYNSLDNTATEFIHNHHVFTKLNHTVFAGVWWLFMIKGSCQSDWNEELDNGSQILHLFLRHEISLSNLEFCCCIGCR